MKNNLMKTGRILLHKLLFTSLILTCLLIPSSAGYSNSLLALYLTNIPDQTVAEGDSFMLMLDDYISDDLYPDNQISWTCTDNLYLSFSLDSITRIASLVPLSEDWYGIDTVIFTATNPANETHSDTVVFNITAINDPPVVADIPNQTVAEGISFASISLDNFVSDPENPDASLSWSATGMVQL
ncbi:MAG: hypothetical protein JXB00_12175, partial [Bacteroidales bacterium]|nr:hypothetical protein [Bacteroidales bacterium]